MERRGPVCAGACGRSALERQAGVRPEPAPLGPEGEQAPRARQRPARGPGPRFSTIRSRRAVCVLDPGCGRAGPGHPFLLSWSRCVAGSVLQAPYLPEESAGCDFEGKPGPRLPRGLPTSLPLDHPHRPRQAAPTLHPPRLPDAPFERPLVLPAFTPTPSHRVLPAVGRECGGPARRPGRPTPHTPKEGLALAWPPAAPTGTSRLKGVSVHLRP